MAKRTIERKDLHVPYDRLAQRGFVPALAGDQAVEAMPYEDLSVLRRMLGQPLNFLDDLRSTRVRFAEYDDEMIPFERDGRVFDLFATSPLDAFLFVDRATGAVRWHSDWSPDGSGPTFEQVNTNLIAFAKCFCMEKAICYRMRARLVGVLGTADHNFEPEEAREDERELRRFIEATDAPALQSVYWSTVLYELDEGFYQPVPSMPHFIDQGRWRIGGDDPEG